MFSGKKLAAITACAVGVFLMGAGVEKALKEEKLPAIERLLVDDSQTIKQAQDELVAARKELISRLVDIIGKVENRVKKRASVRAAMYVLGEMRAVEGIDVLVEHIAFPWVREPWPEWYPGPGVSGGTWQKGLKGIGKIFPAVDALIKIGEPCLGRVMQKLVSTDRMLEEDACLGVLVGLREKMVVEQMLKEGAEKEPDPSKKKRFVRSLQTLTEMTKDEKRR
ncbi:MAG: hypothetical protein ACYTBJ_12660 [Planctomycetota bacterium]|jgi:hypothetical protein